MVRELFCAGLILAASGQATSEAGRSWPRPGYRALGVDSVRIAELFRRVEDRTFPGIDGIVIVRRGALVGEAYFGGYGPDRDHDLRSATKSVTSLLVGAAIDRGLLTLDTSVVSFFPEYRPPAGWSAGQQRLTLIDLLTMRSGLACDDFDATSPGNEARMYPTSDWLRFFFAIPDGAAPPGQRFSYCTAGVVLAGELLSRAVHESVPAFAARVLWQPLGITSARWASTPTGGTMTGGNLRLTPRDMARLGQLMLDHGRVRGTQVVSSKWVERSCRPIVDEPDTGYRYGLLWWIRNPIVDSLPIPSCHASGNGGQKIYLFPSVDLVVVFVGRNYDHARLGHRQPAEILARYILPAVTP
jgi:CubicO group peptidase (beta-lactamase class C family)